MSSSGRTIEVVASIIPYKNQILLCQRPLHVVHGNKWEFPGGKIKPGENPENALARELDEELGLIVEKHKLIYTGFYHYDIENISVKLLFFMTRVQNLKFQNKIFKNVTFIDIERIEKKNLLEADLEFWPYICALIKSEDLLNRFNSGG